MDAASGNIGRNEGLNPAVDELLEGARPPILGMAPVYRGSIDSALGELAGQTVRPVPGATEQDRRPCGSDHIHTDANPLGFVLL